MDELAPVCQFKARLLGCQSKLKPIYAFACWEISASIPQIVIFMTFMFIPSVLKNKLFISIPTYAQISTYIYIKLVRHVSVLIHHLQG